MNYDVYYLTLEQILVIHEDQIDRYGGSHGLRDLSLLESAIFRPQTTFSGEELYKSIFDKAAAMLHSLILNHPFIDGNKRTAVVATIVFLFKNNYEIHVSNTALLTFALAVEKKEYNLEEISRWLQENTKPLKEQ